MKKYIIIFLLFSLIGTGYLLVTANRKKTIHNKDGFVTIKNNKFFLDGKEFYPIAINYVATARVDKNDYWATPCFEYNTDIAYKFPSKDSSRMILKADMDMIKEMGFNTIRLVGMSQVMVNEGTGAISIRAKANNLEKDFFLKDEISYNKFFHALDELVDIAGRAGLKVILLTNVPFKNLSAEIHLRKLVSHFKENKTIMAYDLFNEPLYFDRPERPKKDVYECVKQWKKILVNCAPNQLSTIGLEGIREVFEWDPNMLDVDFLSLHPYEYEPEQVRNEIYWYGKYIKKPWIIGETAIPADGDSVSYESQRMFANKTLRQAYNCGAIGYSWWQYKDVDWGFFHANYMGVLNHKGETKTTKGNIAIKGTPKPVAEEFKKFDPTVKKDSCICLSNYYNYSQHHDCRIKGNLVDENNKPIEGGVILAWNKEWTHSYHTITRADGSFEVLGNFPFYHWMASATMYSMVRGDVLPDTAKIREDKIPTMNIGKLKISKLTFVN